MLNLNDLRQRFASSLSTRPAAADMSTMRELCAGLLDDVPHGQHAAMLAKLSTMRRASDLWNLRSALFDVIARHHGEQVAKDRLVELDLQLQPYAAQAEPH